MDNSFYISTFRFEHYQPTTMKLLLFFGFLLTINIAFSQNIDTIIFNSDFEKKVFLSYCDSIPIKSIDILTAFQYNASSKEIENTIASFNASLEAKGINKANRKKQIKEIYNQVHTRFLKKYEEEAFFNDIFNNGNYNCVTASALYALVLDYFKIDYIIKETPNHVFIVADPNGTSFLIETTLPVKGVYQFDEKFKKSYVDYLHSNKIISDSEYSSSTIDNLFTTHFESAKNIKAIQLAALQYYNKGVFSYNTKDYTGAVNNFEKALIIYPSPNIQFLYSSALLNLIIDQTGKKKYDGKTLAKYINLNYTSHEALQLSKEHFQGITNEMVVNRPDLKGYSNFYNDLITNLKDSVDQRDYTQAYHEMMAYYYYLKNNHEKVLYHATGAYEINPENIRNQQFVLESVIKYLQQDERLNEVPRDTLISYAYKFPFLLNNEFYVQILSYSFVYDVRNRNVNSTEIIKTINILQKFCRKLLNANVPENTIEAIYSQAATVLSENYSFDGSEAVLKNGIEIIPASERLKEQMIKTTAAKKDFQKFMKTSYVQATPLQLIDPPDYKDEEVYASVKKHMTKCWNVDFFRKDGKTKETKVEQLNFIFLADNKMKFKTGTEEHWGTWKLNASGPTLVLKSNEDQQQFTILIYEATATQMRGILSPYKNENKKIEFNICDK